MIIGIPAEIKDNEYRVGLTPDGAKQLVANGHEVVVEKGAGEGAGHSDSDYTDVGASLADTGEDAWARADIVVKVKEPTGPELGYLRPGLVVFTYFHLAADEALTRAVIDSKCTAIAYETVALPDGSLPLLAPMSEIAGRLATQVTAQYLMKPSGGPGRLLGGVPGVPPVRVLILGAGAVGSHATKIAVGMGADVTVMDINTQRLRQLDAEYKTHIRTRTSSPTNVMEEARKAEAIIGTVLKAGARTPQLITDEDLAELAPGTLLVDVAIDQGGCFAGSRPTTHHDATYTSGHLMYYCVANMPGAVPMTATAALTDQTIGYLLRLADGPAKAMKADRALALGLQAHDGKLVEPGVADAFDLPLEDLDEVLAEMGDE